MTKWQQAHYPQPYTPLTRYSSFINIRPLFSFLYELHVCMSQSNIIGNMFVSLSKDLRTLIRALDKREYLVIFRDNFCLFCIKIYVVTPHLNRLDERVQIRGYTIWFR